VPPPPEVDAERPGGEISSGKAADLERDRVVA